MAKALVATLALKQTAFMLSKNKSQLSLDKNCFILLAMVCLSVPKPPQNVF